MSTAKELLDVSLTDWKIVALVLLLCIFSIPTVIEQVKKMLRLLGLVSARQIEQTADDERIAQLENKINTISTNVDGLSDSVASLISMMESHVNDDKANNVAMVRSTLWRIYKESVKKGSITKEGLKTFTELGKVYERSGGNDIYHDRLYPEIMRLPISDTE